MKIWSYTVLAETCPTQLVIQYNIDLLGKCGSLIALVHVPIILIHNYHHSTSYTRKYHEFVAVCIVTSVYIIKW